MKYQKYSQLVTTLLHNYKYAYRYMNFTENFNDCVKKCCTLR